MHAAADAPPVSTDEAEEVTLLAWRAARPAIRPVQTGAVLLGYAAALALWWLLLPHPAALFVPVVALTGALREFLFPTDCRLTTRGAYVANGPARLFLAWGDVRRATHGDDGVFLSPLTKPSQIDQFRGVRLGFGDGNAEEILAAVRRMRQATTEEGNGAA